MCDTLKLWFFQIFRHLAHIARKPVQHGGHIEVVIDLHTKLVPRPMYWFINEPSASAIIRIISLIRLNRI